MARATRDDKPAERLCAALRRISTALELLEDEHADLPISKIRAIGELALKKHTEAGYKAWVAQEDDLAANTIDDIHAAGPEELSERARREQRRRDLFKRCTPKMILAPANIVAVFLYEQPMWKSWDWPDTEAVNTRMWPFAQGLDVNDPLPDDPRLALPLTVAGFMLYQALLVNPEGKPCHHPNVVMDVYAEIARGIALGDKRLIRVSQHKIDGEVSQAFFSDFTHITKVAETLLLQAVRLGPEMWDLIKPCDLGCGCKYGEPYFIPENPKDKRSYHAACRAAKSRASKGQQRVTPKRAPRKK